MFGLFKKKPVVDTPSPPIHPDYATLPEPRQDRPSCQLCFFWQQRRYSDPMQYGGSMEDFIVSLNHSGVCKRQPEERDKPYWDWCGEFR